MNENNYTACCWFLTSSNISILPSQFQTNQLWNLLIALFKVLNTGALTVFMFSNNILVYCTVCWYITNICFVFFLCLYINFTHQLRARALTMFRWVPGAIKMLNLYSVSALLVLKWTSLNSINTLLALNWHLIDMVQFVFFCQLSNEGINVK